MNTTVEPNNDRSDTPSLGEYKEKGDYISRKNERAIINEHAHTSISLRDNGQINITAGEYSQYKLNHSGMNTEYAIESGLIANRRNLSVDEIIINDHKFNNALYEYSDMKSVKLPGSTEPYLIGDFTVMGTVLVKAWESDLKRYMLIRRQARMPMFSPKLNLPEIHGALGINDPLKIGESIYAYDPNKGYQVNQAQTDGKTYIRDGDGDGFVDPGEDRPGIDRNHQITVGQSSAGISQSGKESGIKSGGTPSVGNINTADAESIFQGLKKIGYSATAACALMGNMQQESSMDPTSGSDGNAAAIGLFQWGYGCDGGRGDNMIAWAKANGKDPWNAGTQIEWLAKEIAEDYPDCGPATLNSMSVEQATEHFEESFERAGIPMMENRIAYAQQFYEQFKNK